MRPFEIFALIFALLAAGLFSFQGIWVYWIIPAALVIGIVLDRIFPELSSSKSWLFNNFIPLFILFGVLFNLIIAFLLLVRGLSCSETGLLRNSPIIMNSYLSATTRFTPHKLVLM